MAIPKAETVQNTSFWETSISSNLLEAFAMWWAARKTRLATGIRTHRDPILDPVLATFLSKVNKNVTDPDYRVSGLRMNTK